MPIASKMAFIGSSAVALTPPLNLSGTSGDGTVTLYRVPSPSPNTTGVRVYRDEQLIATVGPKVTSYEDTGLINGQGYRYTLASVRNEVVSLRTDVLTLIPTSLDTDPVGIFAGWDPSGRLSQLNAEVRKAVGYSNKTPGCTISEWLNSLGREHNAEWCKKY